MDASRLLFAFFSLACFEKNNDFFEICESLFDKYKGICLIHYHLIRQFAQFVTFLSVLPKFLSFTCIPVCLIRHRLIRQFAKFLTFLYSRETFCTANLSFADSIQGSSYVHNLFSFSI